MDEYQELGMAMDDLLLALEEIKQDQQEELMDMFGRQGIPRKLSYGVVENEDLWLIYTNKPEWEMMKVCIGFRDEDISVLYDDLQNNEILVMYHMSGVEKVDKFMEHLVYKGEMTN